jgi:hypothetical protein
MARPRRLFGLLRAVVAAAVLLGARRVAVGAVIGVIEETITTTRMMTTTTTCLGVAAVLVHGVPEEPAHGALEEVVGEEQRRGNAPLVCLIAQSRS